MLSAGIHSPTASAHTHGRRGCIAATRPHAASTPPAEIPVSSHPGLVSSRAIASPMASPTGTRISHDFPRIILLLSVDGRRTLMAYARQYPVLPPLHPAAAGG